MSSSDFTIIEANGVQYLLNSKTGVATKIEQTSHSNIPSAPVEGRPSGNRRQTSEGSIPIPGGPNPNSKSGGSGPPPIPHRPKSVGTGQFANMNAASSTTSTASSTPLSSAESSPLTTPRCSPSSGQSEMQSTILLNNNILPAAPIYHSGSTAIVVNKPIDRKLQDLNSNGVVMTHDQQLLRVDHNSGNAVKGHLQVGAVQQKAFDAITAREAEIQLLRLEHAKKDAALTVDRRKRIEVELEYDEKEYAKTKRNRFRWRLGCIFSAIFLCPIHFACFDGCFGKNISKYENKLPPLKQKIKELKKAAYLLDNEAVYTAKVDVTNAFQGPA